MGKGDATRQRIIEEAALLFNQRGYEGSTLQDIMMATDLEKGTIYRYFATKEDLAVAAAQHAISTSLKLRMDDVDHIEGAIEKLRFCIHRFLTKPSTTPGGCPLLNTAIDSDNKNPAVKAVVRAGFAEWKKRLSGIVSQGIASGEISADTKPTEVADMIVASLEGCHLLGRVQGDRAPLKHVEAMLNQLLELIKVPQT